MRRSPVNPTLHTNISKWRRLKTKKTISLTMFLNPSTLWTPQYITWKRDYKNMYVEMYISKWTTTCNNVLTNTNNMHACLCPRERRTRLIQLFVHITNKMGDHERICIDYRYNCVIHNVIHKLVFSLLDFHVSMFEGSTCVDPRLVSVTDHCV